MSKSLEHETQVTVTYSEYQVIRGLRLQQYPKNEAYLSNTAQDMKKKQQQKKTLIHKLMPD